MWLINTSTLMLESFYGDAIPAYAILSHTWGADEVSFQEFRTAKTSPEANITAKAGYRKIEATCGRAEKHGYGFVWVDTCCIDKSSSAELTEAINSMFHWYQQSQVCYVYLSDSQALDGLDFRAAPQEFSAVFGQCRWFGRGWCLQELLAPRNLLFIDWKWDDIGTKDELRGLISAITDIPTALLRKTPTASIWDCPVADRISWIGKRQTTRIEDMAYSLLGILGVNMPMLYGEGTAAFIRLQGEVIRKYNDLSIFAWAGPPFLEGQLQQFLPVLAASPSSFVGCSLTNGGSEGSSVLGEGLNTQFSLTNRGVYFPNAQLRFQRAPPGHHPQYLLDLNYQVRRSPWRYLPLQKIGPSLFARIHSSPERTAAFRKILRSAPFYEPVCILDKLPNQALRFWANWAVRLRWKPWDKLGYRFWHIRAAEPRASWDMADNQFLLALEPEPYLHIEFVPGNYSTNPNLEYFVVAVRIGNEMTANPAVVTARLLTGESLQGVNRTWLGFRGENSSAVHSIQGANDPHRISISGYAITMSLELVRRNGMSHHLIYLDWTRETTSDVAAAVPDDLPLLGARDISSQGGGDE